MRAHFFCVSFFCATLRAHDFHVSYCKMAVEGRSVVCRIKLFKDDLESALARFQKQDDFHFQATPLHEKVFLDYLNAHFLLELNGRRAEPLILSTGEDGATWWAELQFTSTDLPQSLSLKNTLLFELFDGSKKHLTSHHAAR